MKCSLSLFFLCIGFLVHSQTPVSPLPDSNQLKWQNRPFYLFIHFGPNTFTDLEWGKGSEKEEIFNPSALDCRQWCRIAKAAGATGIVITAKHHDGFCLWPSAYSKHTVAKSSWRKGKGDVLRELSAACREYDLSMGVYLSPWDRNHPAYGTPAYNQVFINMMKEVVRNYGPFFEFWWDGANGEGPNGKKQAYDWHAFESTIREIAPNTLVFSDIGPDIRWTGNENGIAGSTNWNLLDTAGFSRGIGAPPNDTLNQGNVSGANWIPMECDVSIRPGWFYHIKEDSLVKTPEKLFDIYLKSIGRGANLILNVPPDTRGLITSYDSAALLGFAALCKESFKNDLIITEKAFIYMDGKDLTSSFVNDDEIRYDSAMKSKRIQPFSENRYLDIYFRKKQSVNCIALKEPLRYGQSVKSFTVELYDGDLLSYHKMYSTIGHLRLISFPLRQCNRIRIRIKDAKADPTIEDISVYRIPEELAEK